MCGKEVGPPPGTKGGLPKHMTSVGLTVFGASGCVKGVGSPTKGVGGGVPHQGGGVAPPLWQWIGSFAVWHKGEGPLTRRSVV